MAPHQCDSHQCDPPNLEPTTTYDILLIGTDDLIDLHSPESNDFPFCGSPVETEEEVQQVQDLLMKASPPCMAALSLVDEEQEEQPDANLKIEKKNRHRRKPVPKPLASYGHNPERVKEITAGNARLAKRLVGMANAPLNIQMLAEEHAKHKANAAASSIARRRKEEDKIIEGNLRMYGKLQGIRPSNDVSRKVLEDEFSASRRYMPIVKREQPRPMPPGLLQKREWDDRWHLQSS